LFSTCANEAGWNSDVIEKQLSHEERDGVRGAYNRAQWLAERSKLMQWWANHLETLRTPPTPLPGPPITRPKASASRNGALARSRPRDVNEAVTLIESEMSGASMPPPALQGSLPDPIEVLRALVAALIKPRHAMGLSTPLSKASLGARKLAGPGSTLRTPNFGDIYIRGMESRTVNP
jgi:hypothetical protein